MDSPKILVFAGSTGKNSFNKKLARLIEKTLCLMQAEVTYLDLRDLAMPLFDNDLEEEKGIPENGMKFRRLLKHHHAFFICSPEYNSSISGVLKNAIDWASRPLEGEAPLVCFVGKIINLASASTGKLGGIRGLATVRSIFGNIGSLVLPDQFCVPFVDKAFTPEGNLVDAEQQLLLEKICETFMNTTKKKW